MALEPGDDYDCPACGATHEIRQGKDLQVPGSSDPLAGGRYVRCPEAGVFDPVEGPPSSADGGGAAANADSDANTDDDWP